MQYYDELTGFYLYNLLKMKKSLILPIKTITIIVIKISAICSAH